MDRTHDSDSRPAQVIFRESPAMAEYRREQAIERLRTRKFARYAIPTERTTTPERVVREAMREARIRRAMNREGMPTPVPARDRHAAKGSGVPVTGDLADDYACPTDPQTGRMITPELVLITTPTATARAKEKDL